MQNMQGWKDTRLSGSPQSRREDRCNVMSSLIQGYLSCNNHLEEELENYGPFSDCLFLCTKFCCNITMPAHLHIFSECFHDSICSCDRDCRVHKPKVLSIWSSTKNFANSWLRGRNTRKVYGHQRIR